MNKFWSDWRPASCLPDCWCEMPRFSSWLVEPANTWSNISYLLASVFIFRLITKTSDLGNSELTKSKSYFYIYSAALFFLGLGSGFFHMSLTYLGQWCDLLGMYLVTYYFILYNFVRIKRLSDKGFLALYILSNAISGYLIYAIPMTRRYLFAVAIILILMTTFFANKRINSTLDTKKLNLAIGSFLLAFGIWNLDKFKVICYPTAWINGHAIWHLICGYSAYILFKYFASEKISDKQ